MATVTAASASAAMAAAGGFDKRVSSSSSLQTPGSGTFPSEMLSPMAHSPGFMKREDALKTPITPPSAYLDFLRNLTPAMSPASAGTKTRFSFAEKPFENMADTSESRTFMSPPTSEPTLSRNASYDSNGTTTSTSSDQSTARSEPTHSIARRDSRPGTPRIVIPSSQFVIPGPRSSRTPRRLNIPASPFTPAMESAQTAPSPYITSATPTSAAPWSATFSPREPHAGEAPTSKVSVRHVVTRTVTYCRTPLDPAPKGKRRKLGDTGFAQSTVAEEPQIKQEKIEPADDAADDRATDGYLTDATVATTDTDISTATV